MSDDLARWRSEFPILERCVYLISNSLGAMPRAAAASLAEYAETWATRGVRAWEERWWTMSAEVGDRIARLVGAPGTSVSMHENVTTATMVALSTVEPRAAKDTIVCLESDFPSVVYLYRAQERAGFHLKLVPGRPDFSADEARLVDAIDDRTAVVCLSHVLFRSSYIMDPRPIVERAHAVGAPVILDMYQSAGITAADVTALGVDFAVGGCLKWLCGGPGNAFLYTRPDLLATLKPRFTGWLSHPNPFAFDTGPFEARTDAGRMMNGTPAIPAYYAAIPGLDIVNSVGIHRIREKSRQLTGRLLDLVDAHRGAGCSTIAARDPERLAGTVAVNVPDALAVSRALKARDFVIDYRPRVGIRISPHFYNTLDELDRIFDEMIRLVRTRDYDTAPQARSVVT